MSQQQQQQAASYDLLAVFPDETKADTAAAKLQKEGFTEEEVHRLTSNSIRGGIFREHGPSSNRSEIFLQTQRTRPTAVMVILFALLFGLVFGAVSFLASFALPDLRNWVYYVIGVCIGLVVGIIVAFLRRGRVRGNIGQKQPPPSPVPNAQDQSARTVIALRFLDAENISRKSRARAILLNNQGKIDRSIGRQS